MDTASTKTVEAPGIFAGIANMGECPSTITARRLHFAEVFEECQESHYLANWDQYGGRMHSAEGRADFRARFLAEVWKGDAGAWDQNGPALKAVCKRLGIKNTRKAINAYVRGE